VSGSFAGKILHKLLESEGLHYPREPKSGHVKSLGEIYVRLVKFSISCERMRLDMTGFDRLLLDGKGLRQPHRHFRYVF
jgi:hypothetical protein